MRYRTRTEFVDAILYNGENWQDVCEILHEKDPNKYIRMKWMMYCLHPDGHVSIHTRNNFHKVYELASGD